MALTLIAALTVGTATLVFAQVGSGFDLRGGVSGAGGNSTGGDFSMAGSVGQPEVGASSGGSFAVSGGFLAGPQGTPVPTAVPEEPDPDSQVSVGGVSNLLVSGGPGSESVFASAVRFSPDKAGTAIVAAVKARASVGKALVTAALSDPENTGQTIAKAAEADPDAAGQALADAVSVDARATGKAFAHAAKKNHRSSGKALARAARRNHRGIGRSLIGSAKEDHRSTGRALAEAIRDEDERDDDDDDRDDRDGDDDDDEDRDDRDGDDNDDDDDEEERGSIRRAFSRAVESDPVSMGRALGSSFRNNARGTTTVLLAAVKDDLGRAADRAKERASEQGQSSANERAFGRFEGHVAEDTGIALVEAAKDDQAWRRGYRRPVTKTLRPSAVL